MNTTIRRIAVSGSAAVALLGGVAAITTVNAPPASATDMQTAINRATGAPVSMPDGRVVHVRGLDNAAYRADAGHRTAVIQLAATADTQPAGPSPQGGVGTQLQQTGYNQQIQTQAGGGAIGIGVVTILVLGLIAFFRIKGSAKVSDAVLFTFLGVALSGTVFGVMAKTMTESGVGSIGGILGGL